MEDNKDNSVKETEQKPQEQTEGKTGGKTMAEQDTRPAPEPLRSPLFRT